jgi:hypothetical protein
MCKINKKIITLGPGNFIRTDNVESEREREREEIQREEKRYG